MQAKNNHHQSRTKFHLSADHLASQNKILAETEMSVPFLNCILTCLMYWP